MLRTLLTFPSKLAYQYSVDKLGWRPYVDGASVYFNFGGPMIKTAWRNAKIQAKYDLSHGEVKC